MNSIDELRQRVEAAESRFGLITERQRQYSDRVLAVIAGIEGRLAEGQARIAELEARLAESEGERAARVAAEARATDLAGTVSTLEGKLAVAGGENEELRHLLHGLLKAIESGHVDTDDPAKLQTALHQLESRVSALMTSGAAVAAMAAGKSEEEAGDATDAALAYEGVADPDQDDDLEMAAPADEPPVDHGEPAVAADLIADEMPSAAPVLSDDDLTELQEAAPEDDGMSDLMTAPDETALSAEDIARLLDPTAGDDGAPKTAIADDEDDMLGADEDDMPGSADDDLDLSKMSDESTLPAPQAGGDDEAGEVELDIDLEALLAGDAAKPAAPKDDADETVVAGDAQEVDLDIDLDSLLADTDAARPNDKHAPAFDPEIDAILSHVRKGIQMPAAPDGA